MQCLMNAWHDNEKMIKSWLIKKTGNYDQAQDLLQDIFIKALHHKELFCTLDDAKSWLFKVARNSLIDHYRKSKLHIDVLDDEVASDHPPVHNSATVIDLQHCLTRVILELDEDDKDIIEQCDIHGLAQADYAVRKQLSLSATKSRIQRARKKLRQQMIHSCNVQFEQEKVCCFTPRK